MTSTLGGVRVLTKANALLEVLAVRGPQTVVELARETGEPRTTIYRLLATLQPMGWVEETPRRGRYALGLQLVQLGRAAVEQEFERRLALPALRALRNDTGLTVYLTVLRGLSAVCVERIDGREVLAFGLQFGGSLPLHAGAGPNVLLAFGDPAVRQRWRESVRGAGGGSSAHPAHAAHSRRARRRNRTRTRRRLCDQLRDQHRRHRRDRRAGPRRPGALPGGRVRERNARRGARPAPATAPHRTGPASRTADLIGAGRRLAEGATRRALSRTLPPGGHNGSACRELFPDPGSTSNAVDRTESYSGCASRSIRGDTVTDVETTIENEAIPYRGEQPYGVPEDVVIPKVLDIDETDERLWVPQSHDVTFRPLLLSVSHGYFVNILRVRRTRRAVPPPPRRPRSRHHPQGSLALPRARLVGRGGRLRLRAARRHPHAGRSRGRRRDDHDVPRHRRLHLRRPGRQSRSASRTCSARSQPRASTTSRSASALTSSTSSSADRTVDQAARPGPRRRRAHGSVGETVGPAGGRRGGRSAAADPAHRAMSWSAPRPWASAEATSTPGAGTRATSGSSHR